ncbi:MAG TPA: aminotransferase class I/II-fold pyridoxal phosphate-dependent enzyme [Candidatus Uhrbacteria bacterium]|nr:aminotransferase class I/II-fold pyridoxal phosphate-dependent enzyme [Candidatus Uhrbacteria bacterium]
MLTGKSNKNIEKEDPMKLADRVEKVKSSLTVVFDGMVKAKIFEDQKQGITDLRKRTIALAAGEPDFGPPQAAIDALHQKIDTPKNNRYSAVKGKELLLAAISQWLKQTRKLEYSLEEIIASSGAKMDIYLGSLTSVNPGDRVLIPSPYWTSYPDIIRMCDGEPVCKTWAELEDLGNVLDQENIRVMILNSPNNPSGQVISPEKLAQMAAILADKDVLVISDEVYWPITYAPNVHVSIAQFPGMKDKTLVIDGASKAFAMAGYRLGWAAGPKEWIAAMAKFQGQTTSCPSTLSQEAVLAALEKSAKDVEIMRQAYEIRLKKIVLPFAKELGLKYFEPGGAFYFFFKIPGRNDCYDFCLELLEKEKVGLTPGVAFGCKGWARISYAAASEELTEAFARIKKFLGK